MALIQLDHVPESVKVNLPLHMIIPEPGEMQEVPVKDRKVLYLLHGLSDDGSAWQRYSAIEIYAKRYGLVVVMPSFGRSLYLDQPNGQRYFTYLVDELPRYLNSVFGIKPAREKTLIAGLSMGGYGAMKAALKHPDRYFAAASFSGLLSLEIMDTPRDPSDRVELETLFGDMTRLKGGVHEPLIWLQNAAIKPEVLPRLYCHAGLRMTFIRSRSCFRRLASNSTSQLTTTKLTENMTGIFGM